MSVITYKCFRKESCFTRILLLLLLLLVLMMMTIINKHDGFTWYATMLTNKNDGDGVVLGWVKP